MEDESDAALSQLLWGWEDGGSGASSSGSVSSDLLDVLGELHTDRPLAAHSDDTPTLSRSSLCRRRQREEIKRLRDEVAALEIQWERLCESVAPKRRRGPVSHDVEEKEQPPVHTAWERVARRQRELKRKAEHDNLELRRLVDEHDKHVRRIERVLRNRALEEQSKRAVSREYERAMAVHPTWATDRWLVTAATPHWQRIFRIVFQNDSHWNRELEGELLNISTDSQGNSVIEGLCSKVFPFDLSKTCDATWHSYTTHFMALAGGYYSVTSASENLLVAEFQVGLDVAGQSLLLGSEVVIHKVHEQADRVVFVWENCSPKRDSTESGQQASRGESTAITMRMTLDVCVSVEQLVHSSQEHDVENRGPSTRMRIYSISRPDSTGSNPGIRVSRDELLDSYHDSNRQFTELIEAYLRADALVAVSV